MTPEKKLSSFINESKKLIESDFEKKTRIAVIGSFTLNGLEETLRVKSQENKINCFTYLSGYNQINQELPNTKLLNERALSIPIHPNMTIKEASYVASQINKFYDIN